MVAEHPNEMVYFGNKENAQLYINIFSLTPPGRKFYYSKTAFLPFAACIYHTKSFYAKEEMNRKIMALRDYGIVNHVKDSFILSQAVKSGLREGTPLPHPLTVDLVKLEHILVSIVVLCAVYGLAVATVVIEINDNIIETKKKRKAYDDVPGNEIENPVDGNKGTKAEDQKGKGDGTIHEM